MGMIYGPTCNCGTLKTSIRGYGPDDAEVMAIGIAPGRNEAREGRPFIGDAGQRFDLCLRACRFDRDDVYCTNLLCWWKDEPTQEEIAACWPRLRHEIELRRPRLILALGALASEWLTGYKVGKVRGGILRPADLAGSANLRQLAMPHIASYPIQFQPWDYAVMSTWHPAATLKGRNPALVGDLIRDFRKIPRFLAGELDPVTVEERPILTRAHAQRVLHSLTGRECALDVETTFDTPIEWGRLLCLSIATREGDGRIVSYTMRREVLSGLDWPGQLRDGLLGNAVGGGRKTRWGFHSGPFDRNVLRRELGIDLPIVWDSMYDSYAHDERPGYDRDDKQSGPGGAASGGGSGRNKSQGPGYHNLDQLAREYCGAGFFKSETQSWIGEDPDLANPPSSGADIALYRADRWRALLSRNALDAGYTLALPHRLPPGQQAPCYSSILIPTANAYADVTRNGVRIDQGRLRELESDWTKVADQMEAELTEEAADLGYTNPPKRKRDVDGPPFNPASTTQLARLLYDREYLGIRSKVKTKKGKPSTSEEALLQIDHPFVAKLMRLRKYQNTIKYLPIIRRNLRPDGRVHPTFLPLVTGRYSAVDPNMQNFPQPYSLRDAGVPELAVLRQIIIPEDGYVLCETDYEQIEIWVAALLSQDQNMLADLQEPFEGGKPNYHSRVTRNVLRCTDPVGSDHWDKVRRGAKVFTFGIEFGEKAKGLAKHASQEMGERMSEREAEKIIRNWYARYDAFARWQRGQIQAARRYGYIENPFGFIRRFPLPEGIFENQMVNSNIQGTASQHGSLALVELCNPEYLLDTPHYFRAQSHCDDRPRNLSAFGGRVLITIHDSTVTEIREDRIPESIELIERVMSTPRIPGWPGMKVESKVGRNWFDMEKYHG